MSQRVQLAPNFFRHEFACRCGCGFESPQPRLVRALQALREKLNAPVHINSGCRCPSHNESEGGGKNSQHLRGTAADIRCGYFTGEGDAREFVYVVKPDLVAELAETVPEFLNGGIGRYNTFTHVDVRGEVKRWDERKKGKK